MVDCKFTVLYKLHFLIIQTQIKNFVVHIIYHAVETSAKLAEDCQKIYLYLTYPLLAWTISLKNLFATSTGLTHGG